MPGPVDFLAEFAANASKPAFKVIADPGAAKLPKTEFDKFVEARLREAVVVAPALVRFFPATASTVTRPALALDFSAPGAPRLTRYAPLYAAPQPIGVVPPSAVGLPPGYFGRLFPSIPPSTVLHTAQPTPEQQKEFQIAAIKKKPFQGVAILNPTTKQLPDVRTFAAHVIDAIVEVREVSTEFLANELHAPAVGGLQDVTGGNSVITLTVAEVVSAPASLPPAMNPAALPPATSSAAASSAPAPAGGGFGPTTIKPTNMPAIINASAAEGIRQELITERADP